AVRTFPDGGTFASYVAGPFVAARDGHRRFLRRSGVKSSASRAVLRVHENLKSNANFFPAYPIGGPWISPSLGPYGKCRELLLGRLKQFAARDRWSRLGAFYEEGLASHWEARRALSRSKSETNERAVQNSLD